jgi:hypothetical protein
METVEKLQLLHWLIMVWNVNRMYNANGQITHQVLLNTTIAGQRQMLSLLVAGIGKRSTILGLSWLIQENPDINYWTGQLQWRPTSLSIVEDNNDKEGGDFLKPPYLFPNFMAYNDSFPLFLAETFEEPDLSLNVSCLDILWIKLSDLAFT